MEWVLSGDEWILKDGIAVVLTLSTCGNTKAWHVIYPCLDNISTTFCACSEAEAKWRSVLFLNEQCNGRITRYSRLRDRAPSLHELYDAVEVSE